MLQENSDVVTYDDQLIRKVTLRLIPFMMVLYIVSYLDRINISFAALQMNADLHLTDEQFGLNSGIFFLGYCLFGIPSNLLIGKLGPRRWISLIMIVWGLVTVTMFLVKDSTQFFILRLILGFAEAGFFPGMILYLTYWFPAKYYGAAVARFMSAIPFAGVLGSAVAAWVLELQMFGLAGWMWLFIVTGFPAVILGIVVLFVLPDRPATTSWLSDAEKEKLSLMLVAETKNVSTASDNGKSGFFAAFKQISVWRFTALYLTLTVTMYGFQLWLPQIIKGFGSTNNSTTALLSAIPAVFQFVGMLLIAGNSDRTGERRYHLVAASGFTVAGLALACWAPISWMKLAGLCLAAFGIWGAVGPFWALTRANLAVKFQPTGIAIINSVGNLGGFVGPFLVGLVKQESHDFAGSLIVLAVASLVAGILAATAPKGNS